MTNEQIWSETNDLAQAWRASPAVQALNDIAPMPLLPASPIAKFLQDLNAGGAFISAQPLALVKGVQIGMSLPRFPSDEPDPSDVERLLTLAGPVEAAHVATVAWIRSRLPGYPMLNMPQLSRDTALTTEEWTHRYPWRRVDRAAALQYQDRLAGVDDLLGQPKSHAIATQTGCLVQELAESEEWVTFADAGRGLADSDKQALKTARAELQERLAPDAVTEHEPDLALPRRDFREHHTREVIEELAGPAGDYARSFTRVNDLIDLVVVRVFAQLVRAGAPVRLVPDSLEFDGTSEGRITADLPDSSYAVFLKGGELLQLESSLMTEMTLVDGVGVAIKDNQARVRIEGQLLPGSHVLAGSVDAD